MQEGIDKLNELNVVVATDRHSFGSSQCFDAFAERVVLDVEFQVFADKGSMEHAKRLGSDSRLHCSKRDHMKNCF